MKFTITLTNSQCMALCTLIGETMRIPTCTGTFIDRSTSPPAKTHSAELLKIIMEAHPEPQQPTEYRCKDDPEANGRTPQQGDQRYTFTFRLEDGQELKVHMGKSCFASFIAQMMVVDCNEGVAGL